jgi:crotonobetainyl-CoA:carnitine CoA-transferase CaiB-like acyl-CoA transferase
MLDPYRVLDLTTERGLLCGQIFGDLGADVIKVEPPGGSPARQLTVLSGYSGPESLDLLVGIQS